MTDFTQIINECLAVSAEDFPAEPDDERAWHFTDKDIRGLLARVAERVEEQMFDPHRVASVVATIAHERDTARKVGKDYHRRAKRAHAQCWGDENAKKAFREIEEKHDWLKFEEFWR